MERAVAAARQLLPAAWLALQEQQAEEAGTDEA